MIFVDCQAVNKKKKRGTKSKFLSPILSPVIICNLGDRKSLKVFIVN